MFLVFVLSGQQILLIRAIIDSRGWLQWQHFNYSSKFFFSGVAIIAYKSLHFSVEKKNVLKISLIINAYQLMWKCFKNRSSHTNSRDYSTQCMYAYHWAREAAEVQILQIQINRHDHGQTRTALKGHPLQQQLLKNCSQIC